MIKTAAMTNFEKQLQKRMTRMIENQIKAVIYVLLFLALPVLHLRIGPTVGGYDLLHSIKQAPTQP